MSPFCTLNPHMTSLIQLTIITLNKFWLCCIILIVVLAFIGYKQKKTNIQSYIQRCQCILSLNEKKVFFLHFAEVIDDDVQYIWIKEPTSTKLSVCNAMICSMSLVERGTSSYFTSPCIRFFWSVDFVQENVGIQGVPINMGIQWRIWYRLFK